MQSSECVQLARETTCLGITYALPDGKTISIAQERFLAPEVLFNPQIVGSEAPGLSESIHECVHSLPIDMRLGMYKAILLSGGTMMLPGMSTRLERDLKLLYLDRVLKVSPEEPASRNCAAHTLLFVTRLFTCWHSM
jgi:actin-related protein 2